MATFLFLGTGSSSGTPCLLCPCSVCQSSEAKNKRLRSSALVETEGRHFLIDAGPDLRQQALTYAIRRIDALFLTHTHYDHIAGLEELRAYSYCQGGAVDCVLSKASFAEVKKRYSYLFEERTANSKVMLNFQPLGEGHGKGHVQSVPFAYMSYFQCNMEVSGFRFGSLAYLTDIGDYDPSVFEQLQGVETLILGAARPKPSPCQLSFEEAAAFAKEVNPKITYLTHISHEVDHERLKLPAGVHLAYDGLKLNF
ncbi:MAG: phnP [Chlamydiales bacterium]|jgi:phosphoribosyl 1,2-cyclic phosphate phosphodiesterase|nr:phnP [Chlamydiales bacterium]